VITFGAAANSGAGNEIVLGTDDYSGSLIQNTLQLDITPTGQKVVLAYRSESSSCAKVRN